MKIYIIPTQFGLMAAVLLGIMVMAGVTYTNNSVFLIAFTLASLLLAIMIETHRNLKALEFVRAEILDGFAGETTELRVWLKNATRTRVHGLEIFPNQDIATHFQIGSQDQRMLISHVPIESRGRHKLKRIRIGTTAPVGLFWAWAYVEVNLQYLGYPKPAGQNDLPLATENSDNGSTDHGRFGEDFAGHKLFEQGASWRRVDWKAVSRGRPWLIKQFEGGNPTTIVLDYASASGSTEERLSQLSLWVKRANHEDAIFALKLPTKILPHSSGTQHAIRCLEELGEYDDPANQAA